MVKCISALYVSRKCIMYFCVFQVTKMPAQGYLFWAQTSYCEGNMNTIEIGSL